MKTPCRCDGAACEDVGLGDNEYCQRAAALEAVNLRLCINCQHIGTNGTGEAKLFRCFAPGNVLATPDLVTGGKRYKSLYCYDVRESVQLCGSRGEWWEEKVVSLQHQQQRPGDRPADRTKPSVDKLLNDLENL